MKILVTGGAGFIASNVADALIAQGHDVHIIDNLISGNRANVPAAATFHELDIRDASVEALWEQEQFEVLVHHAAQMDVRKSVNDPAFDADVNIRGFLNLMESGRKHGLKKVVFASTGGAIYGEPEFTPQTESHPLQPLSPYGITKLCTEKYLFFYQQQYGIQYVVLRYANIYGPRQSPHGEAGVVAIFTQKMLRGEQPIINGDGLQTRDYTFVGDVVQMNLNAIGYDKSGIFNVGTGIETNVVELFDALKQATGASCEEIHRGAAVGEQRRSVIGTNLAYETFGWTPQVSLQDGMQRTVNWFREREV